MIRNIILDIGMVLIDFHWEKLMRSLQFSDEAVHVLGEKMILSPDWNAFDLGVLPEEQIIEEFKDKIPEYRDEIDLFFANIENVVTSFPRSREWITNLKEQGYQVYLLSNYPKNIFELHRKTKFDFMDLIDGAVISFQIQCTKPDADIYEYLLQKYNLKASESVFLDDRLPNVLAARKLGMQGIHVLTQEQAIEDLDSLLKLCFTKHGYESIYQSRVMELGRERLVLPNGGEVVYDIVKQKGGASVLPLDDDGNVYLVKQYRNTLNRVNLELPAGCYDYPGEPPEICARRELQEELGIVAGQLTYFTEIITDIGISDEIVTIFYARDLEFGERHLDPDEFIDIVKMPFEQALSLVMTGEIVDAKTVVAILGYDKMFGNNKDTTSI